MSEQRIDVYLHYDGSGEVPDTDSRKKDAGSGETEEQKAEKKRRKLMRNVATKATAAIGVATRIGNYVAGRVAVTGGNSLIAERTQFVNHQVASLAGIGTALFLNPAAGAVAAAWYAFGWLKKAQEQNYNRTVEGIGLAQMRERAGPSISRSR